MTNAQGQPIAFMVALTSQPKTISMTGAIATGFSVNNQPVGICARAGKQGDTVTMHATMGYGMFYK